MNILKSISEEKVPVLAWPKKLAMMSGLIECGYVEDSGLILPFALIKKAKFIKIIQLPTTIIGEYDETEASSFLNKAVELLKKEYHAAIIMSLNTSPMIAYPEKALYCKFGSYILDLSPSEEDLFKDLHSKHRNVIKKAMKDGVEITCGQENIDDCVSLIAETYVRQGKSASNESYYRNLAVLGDNCDYWVARLDGKVQGCAIILWDKDTAYYMHGGSCNHPHSGAMNLLQWEVIRKMKARGVKKYDFVGARASVMEGSKLEGIQRFKERFGGKLMMGYRWELDCDPVKAAIYRLMIWVKAKIINRSPDPTNIIKYERNRGNF